MNRKRVETYHCINITKLNKKDNPSKDYLDLIRQLTKLSAVKVRGSDFVKIRTAANIKLGNSNFLKGKVTKYTRLESEQWFDENKNEGTIFAIPENVHPNMVETDYYFWPEKHKLFLKRSYESGSPTFFQVEKYLNVILNSTQEEEYQVNIVQSHDSIERIIKAKEIHYLNFELSYTNADTNEEAEELLDAMYREAEISHIRSQLKSSNNNKINGDSKFVKANLGIARKTGNAEAKIEENDGNKIVLKTTDYPASSKVRETEEEEFEMTLFKGFNKLL